MKTGLAVALAALVLSVGCRGNRNEAPAEAAAAPTPSSKYQEDTAAGTTTAQASPETAATAAPVFETAPPAGAATDPATTLTQAAPAAAESAPPPETRAAATPPPPEPTAQKPTDPLQWMKENEERRADHQQKLAAAEAKVLAADASIAEWQNTVLAFKNPFRPRPALAPEDAQAVEGKDGVGRVAFAEGKLAEARTSRDTAQKELDALKANPPN